MASNVPTTKPDIEGRFGRAWKMALPTDAPPDWTATVAAYLVNAPGHHVMWSWWQVGIAHLRPIEGVPPPNLHYPEAQYEFMIGTLNPEKPLPSVSGTAVAMGVEVLLPPDVIAQFHGVSDGEAEEIAVSAVKAIVLHGCSPDSDRRSWWKAAVAKTVEHYKAGMHGGHA